MPCKWTQRSGLGLFVFVVLALLSSVEVGANELGSITGSPHDLSLKAGGEVCKFCHTSHNASTDGPLWAWELQPKPYVLYESVSLEARVDQPDGNSLLCLGCHDGSIVVEKQRTTQPTRVDWQNNLGTDLSDDHPISFVYDSSLAAEDHELFMPEFSRSAAGGTIQTELLDANGKVQCTSCHDAHDNSLGQFLRIDNSSGDLCQTCHDRRDYELSAHNSTQSTDFSAECSTCHDSHSAQSVPILAKQQTDLCGKCHSAQAEVMRSQPASSHNIVADWAEPSEPLTCSTCHEPHMVRSSKPQEKRILTDPDDPVTPRELTTHDDNLHNYRDEPHLASHDSETYCLDCHDGSWGAASNVQVELFSLRAIQSEFFVGRTNLHLSHARGIGAQTGVGCTYCHDSHGTEGTMGIQRGALLYEWLEVREFPYQSKRSCGTRDALGLCHGD